MKKDILIWLAVHLVIFAIFYYIKLDYENSFKFRLVDYFSENNEDGLLAFLFIETASKNEVEIREYSNVVFKKHNSFLNSIDSTKVIVIYYFNRKDSSIIPPEYLTKLKLRYPKVSNLSQKINYYPNGYVYTSYKSKKKVKNIAKDSLFKTAVFAPKLGFHSKDILKN